MFISVSPASDPSSGSNGANSASGAASSSVVSNGVGPDSVTLSRNNSTAAASTNFSDQQSQHLLHDNGNKRLHVSNIPFRFRDHDLRSMFEVRLSQLWPKSAFLIKNNQINLFFLLKLRFLVGAS